MTKNIVAKQVHKGDKDAPVVISDNPLKDSTYSKFIEQTEGTENKGGDPRLHQQVQHQMSEKDYKRQQAAMERLRKQGFFKNK